jgi:hypothetical protein
VGKNEPESIQRLTSEQKAAVVLSVLKGETSVPDACKKHGVTATEIAAWTELFTAGGESALRHRSKDSEDLPGEQLGKLKRMEEELSLERTLLNALMENVPDYIYFKDLQSRFIRTTRSHARAFHLDDPSQASGRTDFDFFSEEHARSAFADEQRIVLSGESIIEKEERETWPDRRETWASTTKMPLRDEQGRIIGTFGISRDITERREAEQKLRELAALLDIATDAIFVRDIKNCVLYWSKGAETIYGWTQEEVLGKNIDDLLSTSSHTAESTAALAAVFDQGQWYGELHQKARDGRALSIEARWTLVRDQLGKSKGILSVNTDVTERRAIQSQLLRVQRLESLGTLAGGIAHDLNNVLQPILMGVEGLELKNQDEISRNILEIMRTAAQRGASIIRQVLGFARGIEGERVEVQPKHVLREVEQIVRETFPKSIEIVATIPKDMWPIIGDATQMHQVLMNLCVNARDAMPEGGKLILSAENVQLDETYARMHIEARPVAYVVLKVEDTGSGMAPGVIDKIFDPFYTTKEPGKGTGLGLSTTRSIVTSHGGFINVYSEVGKGSSFKVYFPAVPQVKAAEEEAVHEAAQEGSGELILVVDDETGVREITRQILESHGYRVVTAGDGTEALVLYVQRKDEIRVLIIDMMMPYMDGTATIRAIRKIDAKAPIIATSGLMTNGYAKEARGLGVDAFLAKPHTAETLLQTLRDVLSKPSTPAS